MPIEQELSSLINPKKDQLKGILGISLSVVKVENRPGFVWVRMFDNQNEIIKAHNSKVAPTYDLPVIISYDGKKYEIVGVDTDRYANWNSDSAFLPDHGAQHSAIRGNEGGDVVWVDTQQFIPLLVTPTDATGSQQVDIHTYSYLNSKGNWIQAGGTGVGGLTPISPTDSNVYLIMLDDDTGQVYCITGSTFSSGLSGTSDVLANLPHFEPSTVDKPLAAVRATPNSPVGWEDVYDVRQFISSSSSGFTGTAPLPNSITNDMLSYTTGPVVLGKASGTGAIEYLTGEDLLYAGLTAFGAAVEDISSQITGTNTHFVFSAPAYGIWVMADGVKQKDADITFVPPDNEFDLSWSPSTGTFLEVVRLAPVTTPLEHPNSKIINIVDMPGWNTNSATFDFMSPTGTQLEFTKLSETSNVNIDLSFSAFPASGDSLLIAAIYVAYGTTTLLQDIARLYLTTDNIHHNITGFTTITGLPAGTYTFQVKWRRVGTGTVGTNVNDYFSMRATEVTG